MRRVQADEIWAFCYAKQKSVPADKVGEFGYGDVWTWTAICPDTKLAVSWYVGNRELDDAARSSVTWRDAGANRIQLTTDGSGAYPKAVREAFPNGIGYAQLVKLYGDEWDKDHRYSPSVCIGTEIRMRSGDPDPDYISTSIVERSNLTMLMGMPIHPADQRLLEEGGESWLRRRAALHPLQLLPLHGTLKTTPAMAAGVTDHVWTLQELIGLLETVEDTKPRERAPNKKRVA